MQQPLILDFVLLASFLASIMAHSEFPCDYRLACMHVAKLYFACLLCMAIIIYCNEIEMWVGLFDCMLTAEKKVIVWEN